MPKMLIFWKKGCKIATASDAAPPNPRWPPVAGDSAPDNHVVTPGPPLTNVSLSNISSVKTILLL